MAGGKRIEWSKTLKPMTTMNHKLRSDSVFTQLTSEQIEQLEDWLFEEKLSYKEVIEKMEKTFGVKTSQTALGRYFRRLAGERTQEWRVETIAQCLEALATAKGDGTLRAGLFVMANMQAVQLMSEPKPSMREFTAFLRAMTSAGIFEMKRVEAQRAEEKRERLELAEKERKEKEAKQRQEDYEANVAYWNRRDEKRKATIAAKKAEAEKAAMSNGQGQMTKEKAKETTNEQSPPTIKEPAQVELATVEPERGVAGDLQAAEGLNDAKTSSNVPAPELTVDAVSEVPPSGEIAAATKPDELTPGERSGCFRIFRG